MGQTRSAPRLIPPVDADRCPPTASQDDMHVVAALGPAPALPPAPAPTPASVLTRAPAPTPTSPTRPLPPAPLLKSAAPISLQVYRELDHERYEEMPGRTRDETRAMCEESAAS